MVDFKKPNKDALKTHKTFISKDNTSTSSIDSQKIFFPAFYRATYRSGSIILALNHINIVIIPHTIMIMIGGIWDPILFENKNFLLFIMFQWSYKCIIDHFRV